MSDIERGFVYLASASPRRRELLAQLGVIHRVVNSPVDEELQAAEDAGEYVLRLAAAKAAAGWARLERGARAPVLGADTTVLAGGEVLAKPTDRDDAIRMLMRLSGSTHLVLTGVALIDDNGVRQRLSRS